MHLGVLGNAGSWYVRDLERAAAGRGHRAARLEFPQLVARCGIGAADHSPLTAHSPVAAADLDLTRLDAVVVRTMPPGSLEQVVYRMDALARLEAAGVAVLNPAKALECAVDKYLATCRLEAAGLPVPATLVCETADDALAAFEDLGGDVVVKPIFGSEGRGIVRVSDPELALRTFRTLERLQAVLYVQKYVRHEGCDVRVMVLDGRVIGAMRRCSADDFRTNVSRSARAEPHRPTDLEADWALRAAQAVGARFAGIDILYDASCAGYVIEVNAVPGWRAFSATTGIDVAAHVIASLESGG
ncbi:MAG TPA: RimK family alpha-L-glutamate ligase [Planctomycetaceae bacterium]|nr:RimK family alpha-L-glutamate ligase [Planctomycetaceae bacterium]